ncbi:Transcriptional activator HAP5 [Spathaspora sp. JA1]|nr:Transcriptional activator HAP5 [Spathaspora sp. JA1]
MEGYENTYLDNDDLVHYQQPQQQQQQHHQYMDELEQDEGPAPPIVDEAELLAAQAAAEAAAQQQPVDAFNNVAQGLAGKYRDMMMQYWQETINSIEHDEHDFKNHQLPLARIKKVMKTDEDVRMISAEAPILFAKGCDVFITELTMRAWIHAEENKRRTLQKSDIAAALTKSDMFDFLIDVVPREEEKPKKSYPSSRSNGYNNLPSATSSSSQQEHLSQPQHLPPSGDPAIVHDQQMMPIQEQQTEPQASHHASHSSHQHTPQPTSLESISQGQTNGGSHHITDDTREVHYQNFKVDSFQGSY